jgi:hypothetical protein
MPMTTVWSYGSTSDPRTFNYPAFTIEADFHKPVRIKWINDLKDSSGNFLPHLLPVDPTLWVTAWCGRDCANFPAPNPYTGPVPIVPHLLGAQRKKRRLRRGRYCPRQPTSRRLCHRGHLTTSRTNSKPSSA